EANPSTADAGADLQVCATDVALAAVAPASGTGQWSIVTGAGGAFADDLDPATQFSGVAGTTYTLRWTVSNSCTSTTDDVDVSFEPQPPAAAAGADQTIGGTTTLAGNVPAIGTGLWTITAGAGGVIADPGNPAS